MPFVLIIFSFISVFLCLQLIIISPKINIQSSFFFIYQCLTVMLVSFTIPANVLQLPEGGDFGALHCQPSTNFDRSTKPDLTIEPPLLGRCCYAVGFLFLSVVSFSFTAICPGLDWWT